MAILASKWSYARCLMESDMDLDSEHKSKLDLTLSLVLRIGLALSILIVSIGCLLFLWHNGEQTISYQVFKGEPASLEGLVPIFKTAWHEGIPPFIQLGILVLIATPVLRVFSCLIVFSAERDFLYAGLSAVVLTVLLFSFF